MFERPAPRKIPSITAELVAHERPDLDWYRDPFTRSAAGLDVVSRLGMDGEADSSAIPTS
jgi:hypothetical protein